MKKQALIKEATGILVSILFLALGFLAIWLMQSMLVAAGDAVFVSMLLIPIVVYVIFTGRLRELKAPGGLEIKLGEVAEQPVEDLAEDLAAEKVLAEDMVVVPKSGLVELKRLESLLGNPKPIALTLLLGSKKYNKDHAEKYLENFLRYHNFTFIVFLDKKDRVVAYIFSWAMFRIIQGDLGNKLIQLINDGDVLELLDFPGVLTQTVSTNDSNKEALNKMTTYNLEAIPVIDEGRKLKGVVVREQILSKLLLAMAK